MSLAGILAALAAVLVTAVQPPRFLVLAATQPEKVTVTVPVLVTTLFGRTQTRAAIRVWKVGSPHEGDTPVTTVPFALGREAEKMGADLSIEAFPAQGFAARFFDALRQEAPPDILVIDNYGIIEGITTKLGNFTGIGRDEAVKKNLVKVSESFNEFLGASGGWTFLIATSKHYDLARRLALRTPECRESAPDLDGELHEIAPIIATAFLEGAWSVLEQYADPAQLKPSEPVQEQVRIGSLHPCGAWGNETLAFVPVAASFEAPSSIGYAPTLLVLRKEASAWKLLAAARDPVTTGEFVKSIPGFAARLDRSRGVPELSMEATLLSPLEGRFPLASAGARFGDFVWLPSRSADVVAEVAEFAYRNDARLFLRLRSTQADSDQISSGSLWTTGSVWQWRIWSISAAGNISLSETRSF
jgi:hypothetical protein